MKWKAPCLHMPRQICGSLPQGVLIPPLCYKVVWDTCNFWAACEHIGFLIDLSSTSKFSQGWLYLGSLPTAAFLGHLVVPIHILQFMGYYSTNKNFTQVKKVEENWVNSHTSFPQAHSAFLLRCCYRNQPVSLSLSTYEAHNCFTFHQTPLQTWYL